MIMLIIQLKQQIIFSLDIDGKDLANNQLIVIVIFAITGIKNY